MGSLTFGPLVLACWWLIGVCCLLLVHCWVVSLYPHDEFRTLGPWALVLSPQPLVLDLWSLGPCLLVVDLCLLLLLVSCWVVPL